MASFPAASRAGPAPVAVVTDSSACLSKDESASPGIAVVRFSLTLGSETFEDGARDAAEVYARLRAGEEAKTSAISPAAFLDAFRSTGRQSVVCVTVSGQFSATCANALAAAREAAEQGIDARVIDSGYSAMAQGYVVLAAARAAAARSSVDDVVEAAEHAIECVGLVMMIEDVGYLARPGRVPRVAAWASSLLQVRPLVEFREREIRLAGRARTRARALQALVDLLARRVGDAGRIRLTVHHTDAAADASWLADAAAERLKPAEVSIREFSQVMAAHVGPGLVGFAYEKTAGNR